MILVRVYGLCCNTRGDLLITRERYGAHRMTKFPGGGLEYGEGTKDCLIREFREELGLEIRVKEHFYTTDFFQPSAYHEKAQVLSIYYLTEPVDPPHPLLPADPHVESAEFVPLTELPESLLTLPIDRLVLGMYLRRAR